MFKKIQNFFIFSFILLSLKLQAALASEGNFNFIEDSGLETTVNKTGHKNTIFSGPEAIDSGIGIVVTVLGAFVGTMFMIRTIIAGFMWMTANGNEDAIKNARKTIIANLIGVLIVVAAYAITLFVINIFIGPTTNFQ